MDSSNFPKNTKNLFTLNEAAIKLGVSVDELLNWNEYNILKPTITLSGEIGYTSEQIENFIKIQQLSSRLKEKTTQPTIAQQQFRTVSAYADFSGIPMSQLKQNLDIVPQGNMQNMDATGSAGLKPVSFAAISTFSFVFFTAMFMLFLPIKNEPVGEQSIMSQATNKNAEAPKLSSTRQESSIPPVNLKDENSGDSLNQEGLTGTENKLSMLSESFKSTKGGKDTLGTIDQNSATSDGSGVYGKSEMNKNFNKIKGFASINNCPTCVEKDSNDDGSIFDENGNLSGEPTENNLLALTALSGTSVNQDESAVKQTTSPLHMLGFLTFGVLSAIYILKSQVATTGMPGRKIGMDDLNFPIDAIKPRILEVNQKTDGTVVLYFQNEEYKISKPELDSESDQFIARLMELVSNDTKEIDYDTLSDENIRFNTPLSKLVTRLGFVGIKRDLFFPRTSKNKVLFRKYITEDDLIAMRLTPAEILLQL